MVGIVKPKDREILENAPLEMSRFMHSEVLLQTRPIYLNRT